MKKILFIALLITLIGCEDTYESKHRYMQSYYLSTSYPVYLDASNILVDIQVTDPVDPDAAFKIVSNDKYYFVGEKMKGIHIYEKTDTFHAKPLCFIGCRYMKAFDVKDNTLFCNNFTDLLAIDVADPLHAKITHREANYFNNYAGYNLNLPYYANGNTLVYFLGYKTIVLTGIETDANPAPDFSEYDKLYSNLIVKEIPDTMQVDKPYVGFANVENTIYTLGFYSLAICSNDSGVFKIDQMNIYIPNYASYPIFNLKYADGKIFFIGSTGFTEIESSHLLFQKIDYNYLSFPPLDLVSLRNPENIYVALSNVVIFNQVITQNSNHSYDLPSFGATSLLNVNDTILSLGNQLTLYRVDTLNYYSLQTGKQYSNISGLCMMKDGNVLTVANQQGLSFYDISDLGKITLLP